MVAGELHWSVGSFFMRKHHQKTSPISSNPSGQNPEQKIKKQQAEDSLSPKKPVEVGGPKGPEPTRYGDWEKAGRCSDF